MSLLKNLKIIILFILVLLVLILVRNSDQNVFREHAVTAIEITKNNSNLIPIKKFRDLATPGIVIILGSESKSDSLQFEHSIHIPFEKLAEESSREILDQTKGNLILYSDDTATTSKAWIILNQLGYKNVLILSPEENSEELKYKFQPDTAARLEPDTM